MTDRKTLLIVDDDPMALSTLATALCDRGYRVISAESSCAAVNLANSQTFDLAILDIHAAPVAGISLSTALRNGFGIRSLILSASDDRASIDLAIRDGGIGYLVKPTNLDKLIPAIETAIAQARDLKKLTDYVATLERALTSNRQVSVAIGILMAELGFSEHEAFEHLRSTARSRRQKMENIAAEIITSLCSALGKHPV